MSYSVPLGKSVVLLNSTIHIIMPQLALSKRNRLIINIIDKANGIIFFNHALSPIVLL